MEVSICYGEIALEADGAAVTICSLWGVAISSSSKFQQYQLALLVEVRRPTEEAAPKSCPQKFSFQALDIGPANQTF